MAGILSIIGGFLLHLTLGRLQPSKGRLQIIFSSRNRAPKNMIKYNIDMVLRTRINLYCGGEIVKVVLLIGTLYCFGNMNTYMTSYLRTHVPGQEHRLYSDAIWIPTLATLGQGTFMTFAGHLEERIGVRATILLGD